MSTLQYDTEKLDSLVSELHEGITGQGLSLVEDGFEDYSMQGETVTYQDEDTDTMLELNYLARGASVAAINSYEGDAVEAVDNVVEASDDLERFRKEIQQAL